ncbi:ricin-type beta-trefoil lectin protein [Saccharothrix saharensis]|uniref:Ricin-type beta-trefoil lectin protein n=1 Tax=Saccharothrix saharensis TaxID=571190 RepID=A0A543JF30_9PSEU|nr:ricin-type beta-trefoil lectin domain protein [Saccharothrix saharensis]TQM81447.1 ricin-type beta-trefoil lectin protein [Saccharothrix saharensis]
MNLRSFTIRVTAVLAALCCVLAIGGTAPAGAAPAGKAHLFNPNSGLCLNVTHGSIEPGARTEIYNCLDNPVELWELNSAGQLYNPYSGLCLNTVNYDIKASTRTEIWACNAKVAQWSFNGDKLVHKQSGLCLNVYEFEIKPGTPTEIYYCNGNAAELWKWWQV